MVFHNAAFDQCLDVRSPVCARHELDVGIVGRIHRLIHEVLQQLFQLALLSQVACILS